MNSYQYDVANRLTSVNGVNYTWDNNGNLLNDGVNTYVYDSANRLISVSNQSTVSSYQYNGMGDRLTQSAAGGNTTNYTLDLNTGLTQVLNDGTNTYFYGVGRIAERQGEVNEYYLGDALGSVRQLTDAQGEITLTNAYQPYGTLAQTAGNAQTSYGFTGEFTDASGLVYLRARYYDPLSGRFFQIDPSRQEENLYQYAGSNPVMNIDPSGLVYLTFDDGPNSPADLKILNILKQYGAHATFFFHGSHITTPTDEWIIWRVVAEGHRIGDHGWENVSLTDTNINGAIESVSKTENQIVQVLEKLRAQSPSRFNMLDFQTRSYVDGVIEHGTGLFRPHGGDITPAQINAIECRNRFGVRISCDSRLRGPLDYWPWDVDPRDWEAHFPNDGYDTDPSEIPSRICDGFYWTYYLYRDMGIQRFNSPVMSNDDVILLHSYEETAKVLPEIIEVLREKGYTFDVLEPSWR